MPDRTSEKAESRAMNWLADAGRAALVAGLCWMGFDMASAQTPAPAPDATVRAAALYTEHCAACHGAQRTGGMGPALLPESLSRLRPAEALKVMTEGRVATQMPGFADKLSKERHRRAGRLCAHARVAGAQLERGRYSRFAQPQSRARQRARPSRCGAPTP